MIKVFGIWMIAQHIMFLVPTHNHACRLEFMGDSYKYVDFDNSCDDLAAEIQLQLSKSKNTHHQIPPSIMVGPK